jgi:hypothetical protein
MSGVLVVNPRAEALSNDAFLRGEATEAIGLGVPIVAGQPPCEASIASGAPVHNQGSWVHRGDSGEQQIVCDPRDELRSRVTRFAGHVLREQQEQPTHHSAVVTEILNGFESPYDPATATERQILFNLAARQVYLASQATALEQTPGASMYDVAILRAYCDRVWMLYEERVARLFVPNLSVEQPGKRSPLDLLAADPQEPSGEMPDSGTPEVPFIAIQGLVAGVRRGLNSEETSPPDTTRNDQAVESGQMDDALAEGRRLQQEHMTKLQAQISQYERLIASLTQADATAALAAVRAAGVEDPQAKATYLSNLRTSISLAQASLARAQAADPMTYLEQARGPEPLTHEGYAEGLALVQLMREKM